MTEQSSKRASVKEAERKLAIECTTGNEFVRKYLEKFPDVSDLRHVSAVWASRSKFKKEDQEAAEKAKAKKEEGESGVNTKLVLRTMEPHTVESVQPLGLDELVNQNEIIAGTLGEILDVLTELLALAKKE